MQCSKPTLEEKAVEEIQRVLKAINEDVLLFRQKVEGTQKTEKGSAMNIRLFPVYSRVAEPTVLPQQLRQRLPSGWQLSEHQVKTYEALLNQQAEVVFNTA
jgi:hypothetical protein